MGEKIYVDANKERIVIEKKATVSFHSHWMAKLLNWRITVENKSL